MDGVQWDDANRDHIARHFVSVDEVEQVFNDDPLELELQYEGDEPRESWLGVTLLGRILLVAFTEREGLLRPVTAYEPGGQLTRLYLREKGSLQ